MQVQMQAQALRQMQVLWLQTMQEQMQTLRLQLHVQALLQEPRGRLRCPVPLQPLQA